ALDVTRWQFWDLAHWDPACAVFIFENIVKSAVLKSGEPDAVAIAKGTESFHRAAKVLDAQLRGRPFVTGDVLTVADFALGEPLTLAAVALFPMELHQETGGGHDPRRAARAGKTPLAQRPLPAAAAAA